MMPEMQGEFKLETTGGHPEDYKNREVCVVRAHLPKLANVVYACMHTVALW